MKLLGIIILLNTFLFSFNIKSIDDTFEGKQKKKEKVEKNQYMSETTFAKDGKKIYHSINYLNIVEPAQEHIISETIRIIKQKF